MSTSRRTVISGHTRVQTASIRATQCDRIQYASDACDIQHRGGTFDNALSFVLRAVSQNTGLIPDLQDADPVYIRLQDLGNLR